MTWQITWSPVISWWCCKTTQAEFFLWPRKSISYMSWDWCIIQYFLAYRIIWTLLKAVEKIILLYWHPFLSLGVGVNFIPLQKCNTNIGEDRFLIIHLKKNLNQQKLIMIKVLYLLTIYSAEKVYVASINLCPVFLRNIYFKKLFSEWCLSGICHPTAQRSELVLIKFVIGKLWPYHKTFFFSFKTQKLFASAIRKFLKTPILIKYC